MCYNFCFADLTPWINFSSTHWCMQTAATFLPNLNVQLFSRKSQFSDTSVSDWLSNTDKLLWKRKCYVRLDCNWKIMNWQKHFYSSVCNAFYLYDEVFTLFIMYFRWKTFSVSNCKWIAILFCLEFTIRKIQYIIYMYYIVILQKWPDSVAFKLHSSGEGLGQKFAFLRRAKQNFIQYLLLFFYQLWNTLKQQGSVDYNFRK